VRTMTRSRMQPASRPANQAVGHAPNFPLNGRMQNRQLALVQPRHCLLVSVAATAKSRLRRVVKAGHRKIVEVLRAPVAKKRWVRVVAKRKMASRQLHRVAVRRTGTAHRVVVPVPVTGAVMQVVATQAVVQDSATRAQAQVRGGPGPRVAPRAAVAATAATRPLAARALAVVGVAVTTAAAAALVAVVLATQAVVVATTGAARVVVVKAAAMVVATKAAQARAHHVRAGVIAASRQLMDAVVAAQAAVMAAVTAAAPAATEIAAAVVVAVVSQVTVGPHLQVAASALVAAQVIVMA